MKKIDGGVCAPSGFKACGIHCGVRKNKTKKDLAIIAADTVCSAAGTFTRNKVKAAPVRMCIDVLKKGTAQAIICNSGNANACAPNGYENAQRMAKACGDALGISQDLVLVASTGVIGQELPIDVIEKGVPLAITELGDNSDAAANAIMTTDTVKKEVAIETEICGKTVRLGGICKGSGMIHPNMGTMLCFMTTDAAITPDAIKKALLECVERTFNCVSVDGDTSTNDSAILLASGTAGNELITGEESCGWKEFISALEEICRELARAIARDGEGATHLVTCNLKGAENKAVAVGLAKSVISSALVKAAMFGADANWGRVICAMGYSGEPLNPEQVDISFASSAGSILVCKDGAGVDFDEDLAKKILTQEEIEINIDLRAGDAQATAWGCDLTYDYVKINGDYRT